MKRATAFVSVAFLLIVLGIVAPIQTGRAQGDVRTVRGTVLDLHAAAVLQQHQRGRRHCTLAREAIGRVEHSRGVFANRANRLAQHEPRLEDVGAQALAAPRNKTVAVAEERERAVEGTITRKGRRRSAFRTLRDSESINGMCGHPALTPRTGKRLVAKSRSAAWRYIRSMPAEAR